MIADSQYVLVDETPVKVKNEVRFEDVLIELDRPKDSVGIYTDSDGERTVLPPWAVVNEEVPRNTAIAVEEPVTVTEANRVDIFGSLVDDDESLADEIEEANAVTVMVDGEPIMIDAETTVAELKQMVAASDPDVLVFRGEEGDLYTVPDDEPVLDHVNSGQEIAVQPDPGRIWSGSS